MRRRRRRRRRRRFVVPRPGTTLSHLVKKPEDYATFCYKQIAKLVDLCQNSKICDYDQKVLKCVKNSYPEL
jgi:hypothetical protein